MKILDIYRDNKDLIELIKDVVFLSGVYVFFRYLKNKKFQDISTQIDKNLAFRERLESQLDDFIIKTAKNTKDIAIRFVHWKNYPRNLDNDGFKRYPYVRFFSDNSIQSGWIDSTGVNFQEDSFLFNYSAYVDEKSIFFFAPSGQIFKNFTEYKDTILISHLPFTNIINFDFKEFIEYEPVF